MIHQDPINHFISQHLISLKQDMLYQSKSPSQITAGCGPSPSCRPPSRRCRCEKASRERGRHWSGGRSLKANERGARDVVLGTLESRRNRRSRHQIFLTVITSTQLSRQLSRVMRRNHTIIGVNHLKH